LQNAAILFFGIFIFVCGIFLLVLIFTVIYGYYRHFNQISTFLVVKTGKGDEVQHLTTTLVESFRRRAANIHSTGQAQIF